MRRKTPTKTPKRRARSERAKPAKSTAARKRAPRPANLVFDPRFGDGRENLSLEELARRQGVRPHKNYEDFIKGIGDIAQGEDLFEQIMQDRARRRAASRR